jgi:hypothetical protein
MSRRNLYLGQNVNKLKFQKVPSINVGWVLLSSVLDTYLRESAHCRDSNITRYQKIEYHDLTRDVSDFCDDRNVPELTPKQKGVLEHKTEIYYVKCVVNVPLFLAGQDYSPEKIAGFLGDVAYTDLAHCGSKKSNPMDPKSPYLAYLNGLKRELEQKFNTKL